MDGWNRFTARVSTPMLEMEQSGPLRLLPVHFMVVVRIVAEAEAHSPTPLTVSSSSFSSFSLLLLLYEVR